MTSLIAGLRFPLSLSFGMLLTASLFSLLWLFTDQTFEVTETTPVRIEFTRVERDDPVVSRRDEKVAKPRPIEIVGPPRIIIDGQERVDVELVDMTGPTVAVGPRLDVAGTDRDAVPLVRINPTYPPRAAQNGTEGWVRVQFDITTTGAVTNVVAVESEPGAVFDAAAVEAVSRWRYNPSIVNGTAVERVGMQTLLRFTLEDD